MAVKYNLPSDGSLSDVSAYYSTLYNTPNKSTTGNFRYPVSGTTIAGHVYDTNGTIYNNAGINGLMLLLALGDSLNPGWSNPKMSEYIISAVDYNAVESNITTLQSTTSTHTGQISTLQTNATISNNISTIYSYKNLGGTI